MMLIRSNKRFDVSQESAKRSSTGPALKETTAPDQISTLIGNELSHQDLLDIELALDGLLLPYKIDLSPLTNSTIRSSSITSTESGSYFTRQQASAS